MSPVDTGPSLRQIARVIPRVLPRGTAGAAAVLAVLLLAGCGDAAPPAAAPTSAGRADPAAAAEQDAAFATALAEHHHGTLQLVGLAAANAEDPAVLALAGDLQLAHDARLTTLVGLLEEWGRPVPHIEGHTDLGSSIPGVLDEAGLAALVDAPPAEFERTFLAKLLVRYGEAVPLAQRQLAAGGDPAAIRVAAELVEEAARSGAAVQQLVGG